MCLCLAGLACDDLDEFRTDGDDVFIGDVIGSDPEPDIPSFIRRGFESRTRMELTFDPEVAARAFSAHSDDDEVCANIKAPGTISTFVCDSGACTRSEGEAREFVQAALEPNCSLAHDALSQYDFPGGGRVRNYILGARFTTDTTRRHAMVFISLMENGRVEVRVIAPSVLDDADEETHSALFGVFVLERHGS